ncbi:MAG TPA: tetratricopeptide repeat protein [Thermoanaerobaculia bacterium]|nr:tetratricopeptide repeat protein [Thermoanaerobaculia bacterium]
MKRTLLLLIATALFLACPSATVPPPIVEPQGDARFLIDPRSGFNQPAPPQFENAWRYFLAGNELETQKAIAQMPGYAPAMLLQAAMDVRAGKLDEASARISQLPSWTASNVYAAEIALARGDVRGALRMYQQIANPPEISVTRVADLRKRLFDQLVADNSVASLREALQLEPNATAARMLLVQKLLATKSWDEARHELDPILNTAEVDRPDVQEALAEIEVGRGLYQQAIVRYDRLVKRTNEPRYLTRLNAIKEQFALANMPPQYQRAMESDAITRADFATLLYWKVPSIRFAQNVGAPMIAVDLDTDVIGREEMIRAIALGIFPVDAITRRASPNASLSAIATARAAARALAVRGAACVREGGNDPQKVLAACGINDPTIGTTADAPVTGRFAADMAEQIEKTLH